MPSLADRGLPGEGQRDPGKGSGFKPNPVRNLAAITLRPAITEIEGYSASLLSCTPPASRITLIGTPVVPNSRSRPVDGGHGVHDLDRSAGSFAATGPETGPEKE
jgi:hypothetical protein